MAGPDGENVLCGSEGGTAAAAAASGGDLTRSDTQASPD